MLEGQQGSARDMVMARRAREQADRDRATAAQQYTDNQNYLADQSAASADAAQFGQGAQLLTLGSSVGDKYGMGGSKWGGKGTFGNDWGGRLGGAVGGAGMGYGLASMIGDKSSKNKKIGGLIGAGLGLMGWL